MNKKDMTLVVTVLAASLFFLLPSVLGTGSGKVYIYVGGDLYGSYDLSDDTSVHLDNGKGISNDIVISGGSVYMKDATCPGKQCVHTGRISRNDQSIVCAPAGILVIIRSKAESGYDAITD